MVFIFIFAQLISEARIAGALGGRAAEQLVFGSGQVTTGAGGDLQQAPGGGLRQLEDGLVKVGW